MKRIYMAIAALLVAGAGFAQTDTTTTTNSTKKSTDTIKVGNFIIIKKNKDNSGSHHSTEVSIERKPYNPSRVSTNWLIFDLGFANMVDRTDYGNTGNYLRNINQKGMPGKDDLKLKASKSSNVNIWLMMQKLNIAKGYVNLKYGIGLEMFNFRYDSKINYSKAPSYIFLDSLAFSKNKLYAGYITVPFMLNVNTTPGRKKGLSFSAGVSAGYLVGSRDKQISGERGKEKTKGDIGLEQFRLAYVGELGIGPIRLFGSYSITKLHEKGLEQYPYSLGIRFSNW
jgi:hypothetical protein